MGEVDTTGGLIYHARALLYRKSLWQPFRQEISQLFSSWPHGKSPLLVFGASGGYCLPQALIDQAKHHVFVDPDKTAKWIWQIRHRSRLTWHDVRGLSPSLANSGGLDDALGLSKKMPPIFCNLLGQLAPTSIDETTRLAWARSLSQAVSGPFFSFHDRLSFVVSPQVAEKLPSHGFDCHERNTQSCVAMLQEHVMQCDLAARSLVAFDHLTDCLWAHPFDGGVSRKYLYWRLTPTRVHLIECMWRG